MAAVALLTLAACGGGADQGGGGSVAGGTAGASKLSPAGSGPSLNGVVYGKADTGVPDGESVPITMMGQMRVLFDKIKNAPDFTQVKMDLGDGTPVAVLDTKTGDKFLPGKLALGLSYILIDMKTKGDPAYADYLAAYQRVTRAMITTTNPADAAKYLYVNTSWGEYYYLVALNNLKARGMMNEVFADDVLAVLQRRLTFCDMFGADASGNSDTCPAAGTPIDVKSLNTAQNYYAVSYGIAGLRQKLGWSNPAFFNANDAGVAAMGARDALLYTLTRHIRDDSSGGFSDEANNASTTYYDQARFDRYSTLLIGEVVERTLEMDNMANLTDELKGYLRKSVDLILQQLNTQGQGFNYGRSIGPYGDTAFAEVLTAAANAGVLSKDEMKIAYNFIYRAARRYANFWYDPTLPTPSVNMWVKGRGTDGYRGKPRVLGENFSLLHQFLYVNNWWNKLGFQDQAPMPDAAMQAWLDQLPRYTLTWYNQPGDAAHPYSAALVTVRDGKRVINLNMSQAPDYNSFTPYYPVPFSDNLIYGTTDQAYALLLPQVSYGGKNYIPVTYYKNLSVQKVKGDIVVSFDTTKFRQAAKNAKYTTDLDLQAHTEITFGHGAITRTDTLSSATLAGPVAVETDYTGFADYAKTTAQPDGMSVAFADTDAQSWSAGGFDGCTLSAFDTAGGATNVLSTTPIGQLHSRFACTTAAFAPNAGARSFSWTLRYADLP
ncbi:MAG: hypothetical protein JSS56_17865 [Proteobacteria bacterium]|nr:hypothetical protein [Pseudomonadota bacterium]